MFIDHRATEKLSLSADRPEETTAPPHPETEETPASLDVVYAEAKERLDIQLRQIDALDAKSGTILFLASIVIGIGAAAQAAMMSLTTEPWTLLVFSAPILCYLGTIFFALRSWVVRPYFRDPEPGPLRDHYLFRDPQFTKRRILTHFISSYEWNRAVIKKKVRELQLALFLFLAETGSLVVALVVRPWVS